jgi:hypothetical protein
VACRAVAAVSGGALPSSVRGTQFDGIDHVSDWYATIAAFGGVELPSDTGDAPLDSVSLWHALSTAGTASPRTEVLHMPDVPQVTDGPTCFPPNGTAAGSYYKGCSPSLRVGRYKIIYGWPGFDKVCTDVPPSAVHVPFGLSGGRIVDGDHCLGGEWNATWTNGSLSCVPYCLFDVVSDQEEPHGLSADPAHAQTLASLQQRMKELGKGAAPLPAIQNSTHSGKTLEPQMCANYIRWTHTADAAADASAADASASDTHAADAAADAADATDARDSPLEHPSWLEHQHYWYYYHGRR